VVEAGVARNRARVDVDVGRLTYTPLGNRRGDKQEVVRMLWLLLLILLLIAIGGGIVISKFLFLVLIAALIVAFFARGAGTRV
jgi:hypothetical protein